MRHINCCLIEKSAIGGIYEDMHKFDMIYLNELLIFEKDL